MFKLFRVLPIVVLKKVEGASHPDFAYISNSVMRSRGLQLLGNNETEYLLDNVNKTFDFNGLSASVSSLLLASTATYLVSVFSEPNSLIVLTGLGD
jgi:hypothetical protein